MELNASLKKRLTILESWLQTPQGQAIFSVEAEIFLSYLKTHSPKFYVQLGGPTLMDGFAVKGHYFHVDLHDDFFSPGLSVCAEFDRLPFPDQSMDLVLCPHVHEIHQKKSSLCREIERVLSPHGRVMVFGVNISSLWAIQRVFGDDVAPWCDHMQPPHIVIDEFQKQGLSLLKRGSFGVIPFGRSHWLQNLPALGAVSYNIPHIGAIYVMIFHRDVLCYSSDLIKEDDVV